MLFRTDDTGTLSWTQLAGASVDITAAPRDLRLESQGASHRVYFNGVELINYTESAPVYATGQPGIAVYQNASTAKILTFTGGSLSGSPKTLRQICLAVDGKRRAGVEIESQLQFGGVRHAAGSPRRIEDDFGVNLPDLGKLR